MLEWAREAAHRLLGAGRQRGDWRGNRRKAGRDAEQAGVTPGSNPGFKRFLREFQSRNDKALHEHTPGPRPA